MHDDPLSRLSFNPWAHGRKRASDQDRQATLDILTNEHLAGRLGSDEYHQRSNAAAAVVTMGEIVPLIGDLVDNPAVGPQLRTDEQSAHEAMIRLSATSIPLTPEQINHEARLRGRRKIRNSFVRYLSFLVVCAAGLLGAQAFGVNVSEAVFVVVMVIVGLFVLFPVFAVLNRESELETITEQLKAQARKHLESELEKTKKVEAQDDR